MPDVQATMKHDDGSVRVIPVELLDRYTERGWTKIEGDAPEPPPDPPVDPRPKSADKVEAWVEYAIGQGVASYEASNLTKAELIAKVGG